MTTAARNRALAIGLSLIAAFTWATYYLFVLWVSPGTPPSAIVVYPFVFGGGAYAALALVQGHAAAFGRVWRTSDAYVRVAFLMGMQLSVLASTLLAGPVDTSLLALIGDVIATPILAAWLVGLYRKQIGTRLFVAGLVTSLLGGTMAILGGQRLAPVPYVGWLAVAAVPVMTAFYFVLTARAGETAPSSAIVAQSMLAAAVVSLVIAPLVPGGWSGILHIAPLPLAALAATGLTSFFLAPLVYFRAIDRVGLVLPPMLMTAIPVFTLLLSAGVLGLGLPLLAVLGVPVAAAGGILALRAYTASAAPAQLPSGPTEE